MDLKLLRFTLRYCTLSSCDEPESMKLFGETVEGEIVGGIIVGAVCMKYSTFYTDALGRVFEAPNDQIIYHLSELEVETLTKAGILPVNI